MQRPITRTGYYVRSIRNDRYWVSSIDRPAIVMPRISPAIAIRYITLDVLSLSRWKIGNHSSILKDTAFDLDSSTAIAGIAVPKHVLAVVIRNRN